MQGEAGRRTVILMVNPSLNRLVNRRFPAGIVGIAAGVLFPLAVLTLGALTVIALPLSASAQVSYLTDVDASSLQGNVLSTSFTSLPPGVTPAPDSGIPEHTSLFINNKAFVQYNTQTGAAEQPEGLPEGLGLNARSLAAVSYSTGPSAAYSVYFVNSQRTLSQYNLRTQTVDTVALTGINGVVYSSLSAASDNAIAMIAGSLETLDGYMLNAAGQATTIFTNSGGSGTGEFSDARFLSYGPDGRLYVLDYGNNRIQALDPSQGYASVFQFSLNPAISLTNTQFSIGSNGDFYFGDGAGGGSAYDASGNFIQAFSLPAGSYTGISGKSFTAVTPDGNLMVNDGTGQHLYSSAAVSTGVPEPGTLALALPGLLALAALPRIVKRRHRASTVTSHE